MGPLALSAETRRCRSSALNQHPGEHHTAPTECPAVSLASDKVPASPGQGCENDPCQGSRIDQPRRWGLAACPCSNYQGHGAGKLRSRCLGIFVHLQHLFSLCPAAWRAGAVFLWAWWLRGLALRPAPAVSGFL